MCVGGGYWGVWGSVCRWVWVCVCVCVCVGRGENRVCGCLWGVCV